MTQEPAEAKPARGKSRFALRYLPGIAISLACIAFIVVRIDLAEVAAAVASFQWLYLVPGLLALAAGYACRIQRWSVLLRAAGAHAGFRMCAAPFLGSIALNNVLPLRLGDVVRALVFPAAIGVSRSTATASLIVERLIDLLTLVLVLLIGLMIAQTMIVPTWIVHASLALTAACMLALGTIFFFAEPVARWLDRRAAKGSGTVTAKVASRAARVFASLLASTYAMSRIALLPKLVVLSLLVWIGEAGFYGAMLAGFRLEAAPAVTLLVMATVTLSTLIPSSPGYVGTFHLAAYAVVVGLGGSAAQAAGFALLAHLGLWVSTTAAGAAAIALTPQLFRGLRTKASAARDFRGVPS